MKRVPLVIAMLALSACDTGLSGVSISGPTTPPPVPTNAGGIWEGSITDASSGIASSIAGVITEIGVNEAAPEEGRFVDGQGNQIVFTTVGGGDGSVTANVTVFAPPGAAFADGSTVATGLFDGAVIERSSLEGSFLNLGTGEVTSTVSMTYNDDYERGSDLARVEGAWADSLGVIYNVDAVGVIFAQDPDGCVYDGTVRALYRSFNTYRLRLTLSECAGLDGDYLGLGVLGDDAGVDDAFIIQLDNTQVAFSDVLLKQ